MENEKPTDDRSNTLPLPGYRIEGSDDLSLEQPILPTPPTSQPERITEQQRSRHQLFLVELYNKGLSTEAIQTEWHHYYDSLSDVDKNQVWHEFNRGQAHEQSDHEPSPVSSAEQQPQPAPAKPLISSPAPTPQAPQQPNPMASNHFTASLPGSVKRSVARQEKVHRQYAFKEQIKSLLFGLTVGAVFLAISLFTFFNESYIVPFIQPSTLSASTQVIISPEAEATSDEPRLIIPKLNVEVPVVYGVAFLGATEPESEFERRMQGALEGGVVHYPSSQLPGKKGRGFNSNVVIVGHSSNNIFNRGEFKFAFMQLRNLAEDDTFVINYQGRQFVYKIYDIQRVAPSDVWVLGPAAEPNSATLITCDPPGFNVNRLVVFAKQISPNPEHNSEVNLDTPETAEQGTVVPGNPQSLWSRIWNFVF